MLSLFRRKVVEPEPTELVVEHGGSRLPVRLRRRPDAKRMTLRVSAATGQVALTLPPRSSLAAARTFLDAHAGWIAARLARLPGRVPFGEGRIVPVRGLDHRVVRVSGRARTRLGMGPEGEPVIAVSGDAEAVPGRVRRFLHGEAARDLTEAVARHAAALDVRPGRITVRDTTSRWGSCSSSGGLSFSWRLILAPPLVLDYLAAHEVAHLRELNHSHRFWRTLRGLCSATDEAEAWLKRHGPDLHRFG